MDCMVYVLYPNDAGTEKRKKSIIRMVNEWVDGGHFELVFKNKYTRTKSKWAPS